MFNSGYMEADPTEECRLLTDLFSGFRSSSGTASITHSELGPPVSISNQETCPAVTQKDQSGGGNSSGEVPSCWVCQGCDHKTNQDNSDAAVGHYYAGQHQVSSLTKARIRSEFCDSPILLCSFAALTFSFRST